MTAMVLVGMGLSVYQLVAELIARRRRAGLLAHCDQHIQELYARPQAGARAGANPTAAAPKATA